MNNNKYKIIDNFLEREDYESLSSLILDKNFLWSITNAENFNSLFLELIHYKDEQPLSEFYNELVPIMQKIEVLGLVEIRSNLYFGNKFIQSFKKEKKYDFSVGTAIYYLNSNDGYTLLEDGSKIESKENRILLFEDSDYYETNCTDNLCRVNITFNYF